MVPLRWVQEYRDRVETGGAPPAGLAVARGGVWERRSSAGHVDIALRVLGSRDARDVPATVMIEPGGQVRGWAGCGWTRSSRGCL